MSILSIAIAQIRAISLTAPGDSADRLVCDLTPLNPAGGGLVIGALAYSASEHRLYFVVTGRSGRGIARIYSCSGSSSFGAVDDPGVAADDPGQLPVLVRNITVGPNNVSSTAPGAMGITSGPTPELIFLFVRVRPSLLRIPLADLGTDAPFHELFSPDSTAVWTDMVVRGDEVIWCGAAACWRLGLSGEPAAAAASPSLLVNQSGVTSLAVDGDKLWMVSKGGVAACDLPNAFAYANGVTGAAAGAAICDPHTLLSPWSTGLKWMALDPMSCELYHGSGSRVSRRLLRSWNASRPVVVSGSSFSLQRNTVGPAMCNGGEPRELFVTSGGGSNQGNDPVGVLAVPLGLDHDGQPKPTRVLASSDGASPTNFIVSGPSESTLLSKLLFFVSNGDLYRSNLDGTGRTVISYKAASASNATLVRFSVRAIALDGKFDRVYAAAAYSDRAMIYSMSPDGRSAATMCYYVYRGSPIRNYPVQLAVDPGSSAEEPAGVYYVANNGGTTTFFRAFCGGNRTTDVVLRTYRKSMTVSSLHLFDGKLHFVDSTSNQAWECDRDMESCRDLHVNKIRTPNLLATHPAADAKKGEHAVYADAAYGAFYAVPIPSEPIPADVSETEAAQVRPQLLQQVPPDTLTNAGDLLVVNNVLMWRAGTTRSNIVWKMQYRGPAHPEAPTLFLNATEVLDSPNLLAIGASAMLEPAPATPPPVPPMQPPRAVERRRSSEPSPPPAHLWLLSLRSEPTTLRIHRIDADGNGLVELLDIYPWYKEVRFSGFPIALAAGGGPAPNIYFMNDICQFGVLAPGKANVTKLETGIATNLCNKALALTVTQRVGANGGVEDVLSVLTIPSSQAGYYGQRFVQVRLEAASLRVVATGSRQLPGTGKVNGVSTTTTYTQLTVSAAGAVVLAVTGIPGRDTSVGTQSGLTLLPEKYLPDVPVFCSSMRVVRAQPVLHEGVPELRFVTDTGDALHSSSADGEGTLLHSLALKTKNATVDGMAIALDKGLMFWRHRLLGDLMVTQLGPPHAGDTALWLQNPVQWPGDITVDPQCEYVYWSDIRLNKIMRVKVDGSAPAERVAIMPYAYYSSYSPVAQLRVAGGAAGTAGTVLYYTWAISPQSLYVQDLRELARPPRTLLLAAGYGKSIKGFQVTPPAPGDAASPDDTRRIWFGRYEWDPQVLTLNVATDNGSATSDRGTPIPGFSGIDLISGLSPVGISLTPDIQHCFGEG